MTGSGRRQEGTLHAACLEVLRTIGTSDFAPPAGTSPQCLTTPLNRNVLTALGNSFEHEPDHSIGCVLGREFRCF